MIDKSCNGLDQQRAQEAIQVIEGHRRGGGRVVGLELHGPAEEVKPPTRSRAPEVGGVEREGLHREPAVGEVLADPLHVRGVVGAVLLLTEGHNVLQEKQPWAKPYDVVRDRVECDGRLCLGIFVLNAVDVQVALVVRSGTAFTAKASSQNVNAWNALSLPRHQVHSRPLGQHAHVIEQDLRGELILQEGDFGRVLLAREDVSHLRDMLGHRPLRVGK
eukprot:7153916-Pyramimonas_sp.AAC.1